MNTVQLITSKDHAVLKKIRLLLKNSRAYRKQNQIWLEGDHLCQALIGRGYCPDVLIFSSEEAMYKAVWSHSISCSKIQITPALFAGISDLECPASVGCLWTLPINTSLQTHWPTVVLDGLQDAGNAGSIVRSAAALGFRQIVSTKNTVALWSGKVLRAGMGAHFALNVIEGLDALALQSLDMPKLTTSSHQGDDLHRSSLPWPCAWIFGHEGQGVSTECLHLADQKIRIAQPGGEESLNVASAAAICLHASMVESLMK